MPHGPNLSIDRTARLQAAQSAAYAAVWRWTKEREGWGCVIICDPGQEIEATPTVDPEEDRAEGCRLIMHYHSCREATRNHVQSLRSIRQQAPLPPAPTPGRPDDPAEGRDGADRGIALDRPGYPSRPADPSNSLAVVRDHPGTGRNRDRSDEGGTRWLN